mgnify:FL=1
MKYKKQQFIGRILSYILAFCMTFVMIPITVYAQSLGQDDISIEATCQGATMDVYFNGEKIGNESDTIMGNGKGYNNGDEKNTIKIVLSFGYGNIGSVTINNQEMSLPAEKSDQVEFKVAAAPRYSIVVTKSQDATNIPRTIIWDSDRTHNSSLKEEDLLKNGTIEILDIQDENGNSVGLKEVNQDDKSGWANIIPGSKVIMRLKPNYGYQLTSLKINDENLKAGKEQSTFEYIMPDTNVHISGIFEKVDDQVKTLSKEVKSGSITISNQEIDTGSVILSVNDVEPTNLQKTNFEKTVENYTITSYLDIKLDQVVYKGTANDTWTNSLSTLNHDANIQLQLEKGINGNDVVLVHEKHDGTYETLSTTYDSSTNTLSFKTTSFSNYAIAYKTKKTVEKKRIDTIEINGATLSFKVGEQPSFTASTAKEAPYSIDHEGWDSSLGGITSSSYWNKRYDNQKVIDSFKENTKYVYSIYLKLNDKGYNENYYFDKNTKLIINGKTIDLPLESINVDELEADTIWYSNVLEMTPELQNIKIETSQETKKENTNTKVKTGDNTKYMVYMGLIGLSLLGVYCIIMRKYIH